MSPAGGLAALRTEVLRQHRLRRQSRRESYRLIFPVSLLSLLQIHEHDTWYHICDASLP